MCNDVTYCFRMIECLTMSHPVSETTQSSGKNSSSNKTDDTSQDGFDSSQDTHSKDMESERSSDSSSVTDTRDPVRIKCRELITNALTVTGKWSV